VNELLTRVDETSPRQFKVSQNTSHNPIPLVQWILPYRGQRNGMVGRLVFNSI